MSARRPGRRLLPGLRPAERSCDPSSVSMKIPCRRRCSGRTRKRSGAHSPSGPSGRSTRTSRLSAAGASASSPDAARACSSAMRSIWVEGSSRSPSRARCHALARAAWSREESVRQLAPSRSASFSRSARTISASTSDRSARRRVQTRWTVPVNRGRASQIARSFPVLSGVRSLCAVRMTSFQTAVANCGSEPGPYKALCVSAAVSRTGSASSAFVGTSTKIASLVRELSKCRLTEANALLCGGYIRKCPLSGLWKPESGGAGDTEMLDEWVLWWGRTAAYSRRAETSPTSLTLMREHAVVVFSTR